ncbi:MAG TPA: peptidoglycan DD-metalloendopeptidase family protein [Bacteroidia bacterium]|nr:peptidoglycan DD-metalloendopeptidase family protein [Bacteroidia bacterium]
MSLYKLKNRSIRPIWVMAIFCSAFFNTIISQTKPPQNKQTLENKKKKLNDEINEINSLLNEMKVGKKTSLNQLVAINTKISIREELINTIVAEIRQLNREIKQNEKGIAKLKENLEKLKSDYARMIYFAQRNQDSYSRLVFVFASGDFNQAYMRLKYFQQYSQFRKQQATEIVNAQALLIVKVNELKDKRHEKNILLGNEEEERGSLTKEKQEQEIVLTDLQKKEKELKEELDKKKRDAENLQIAIKKLIMEEIKRKAEEAAKAEAAAVAAKKTTEKKTNKKEVKDIKKNNPVIPELSEEAVELSNDFANNRGKLPWPVTKGYICEEYGEHEHPAIKDFMMFNNGIEICSSMGSQARAVFEGEVTAISVSPTGGKFIIIRHGEYLTVYSNLGDVLVKTGQKVSLKQNIGTVLHNEDEGKSSLNLQIWKGQKTMDPAQWLLNAK